MVIHPFFLFFCFSSPATDAASFSSLGRQFIHSPPLFSPPHRQVPPSQNQILGVSKCSTFHFPSSWWNIAFLVYLPQFENYSTIIRVILPLHLFLPQHFDWQKIGELFVCFCIVRSLEKEDFLENSHPVLFFVWLKCVLFNRLCVSVSSKPVKLIIVIKMFLNGGVY